MPRLHGSKGAAMPLRKLKKQQISFFKGFSGWIASKATYWLLLVESETNMFLCG